MRYFAEIGGDNIVLRVIVADSLDICTAVAGAGWWVETFQGLPTERYAGAGMTYAPGDARKFLFPSEVE